MDYKQRIRFTDTVSCYRGGTFLKGQEYEVDFVFAQAFVNDRVAEYADPADVPLTPTEIAAGIEKPKKLATYKGK